jgi:hypothetical protein
MNLYRVQFFHVTSRRTETMHGQDFTHRQGTEKTAFVVAASPEEAGAHVKGKHDCDILGVLTEKQNVEIAAGPTLKHEVEWVKPRGEFGNRGGASK